ncbi:MAG TPA: hypothetical protein VFL83_07510 [Anaeromyxobacter sp.]|nr:hypothetical protein [Anaeromyxobacter sp.]
MRRAAAIVCLALAACRGEPPGREPAGAAAAARADARPPGPPPAAPANPRGDRHARAATRQSRNVKRADGTLVRADGRTVVLAKPGAPPLTLRIAPGTRVTLDGRPARAEALPPGADVRASYQTGDAGRPTAVAIEARRAPEPPPEQAAPDPGAGAG